MSSLGPDVQRPAYFSRVTKVSLVVGAVSRMVNGAAYSILTLVALMKSLMLLKSSSKCLRKSERFWTTGTADLPPLCCFATAPVDVIGKLTQGQARRRSSETQRSNLTSDLS